MSPSHNIQPDVPLENINVLYIMVINKKNSFIF